MSGLRVGVDGGCLWIWGSRYEICVAHACQDEKSSYALIASYKYLTSMNALTKKQVDAANKRRRRAIKYLLEEIRPIPFTEEEIQAAVSNLKENGVRSITTAFSTKSSFLMSPRGRPYHRSLLKRGSADNVSESSRRLTQKGLSRQQLQLLLLLRRKVERT